MKHRSFTRAAFWPFALVLSGASCSTSASNDGTLGSGGTPSGDGGTAAGGLGTPSGGRGGPEGSGGTENPGLGGTAGELARPAGGHTGGGEASSGGDGAGAAAAGGVIGSGGSGGSGGSAAVPSDGCQGTESAESGPFTIEVEGTDREYILTLPDDYDPSHPYRLIFGWHGRMYDAEWVANGEAPLTGPYFGLADEADGDAIFVAPQALSSGWSNEGGRDIAFTKAMLAQFEGDLCVDTSRIFSAGFSFGAMMTISIGCELADTFRAITPMSGSLGNGCPEPARPIAYWASHGLEDTTILPAQGEAARDEFIQRNHCDNTSHPTDREGCIEFENCDPGYPVTWCTFEGVHEPPPFAGPAIWEFLSQF